MIGAWCPGLSLSLKMACLGGIHACEYGPHKTLYNRFKRWGRMGVFYTIFSHLAVSGAPPDTLMIDVTHLKAHRTASSLLKKGMFPAISGALKAG